MKRFRAAVMGGSGYGGAELVRRLLLHPDVELVRVSSVDHVGEALGDVHLPLTGRTELRFENLAPEAVAEGVDVVLLGLPHKVSATLMPRLWQTTTKIVDMSGDFRLTSASDYARFYGGAHPHPELLGKFVYGLPELNRERIRGARAVASPGCFATAIQLALLPLARAGWLPADTVVSVTGLTGSSGSGIAPSAATHHPVRAVNLKTYKALDHQHTPEILEGLAAAGAPGVALRFVPVSAPLSRGILVTAFVELPIGVTDDAVAACFAEAFAQEPFVRYVGPQGTARPGTRLPEVAAVAGSNYAEVGFALAAEGPRSRTVAVVAALDNLIKGGAGQAIENMNLMLGLPETAALEDSGPWP
jgi:N-acetyl-gamma-glutamyl-phosphate reductase